MPPTPEQQTNLDNVNQTIALQKERSLLLHAKSSEMWLEYSNNLLGIIKSLDGEVGQLKQQILAKDNELEVLRKEVNKSK